MRVRHEPSSNQHRLKPSEPKNTFITFCLSFLKTLDFFCQFFFLFTEELHFALTHTEQLVEHNK